MVALPPLPKKPLIPLSIQDVLGGKERTAILHGDSLRVLKLLPPNSIDAIVTDPPAGIEFMGKAWDVFSKGKGDYWQTGGGFTKPGIGERAIPWPSPTGAGANATCATCGGRMRGTKKCSCETPEWRVKGETLDKSASSRMVQLLAFQDFICEVFTEVYRVLKPGGHALVWALPRTSHHTAMGLERAGFEIGLDVRDVITELVSGDDLAAQFFASLSDEQRKAWLRMMNAAQPSVIVHGFGSGFPKSLDVSKAIDKVAGAEREVIGVRVSAYGTKNSGEVKSRSDGKGGTGLWGGSDVKEVSLTGAAVTDAAKKWEGFGTALKPAVEFWILARKPLIGTVAANVLTHGTGALNIDGCRIAGNIDEMRGRSGTAAQGNKILGAGIRNPDGGIWKPSLGGRWPANVVMSHSEDCKQIGERLVRCSDPRRADGTVNGSWGTNGVYGGAKSTGMLKPNYSTNGKETIADWRCAPGCPVAALDAQSGKLKSGPAAKGGHKRRVSLNTESTVNVAGRNDEDAGTLYGDSGGASRFFATFAPDPTTQISAPYFYCAKASRREREMGCEGIAKKKVLIGAAGHKINPMTGKKVVDIPRANVHPTTKPLALMRWLCRLITPPNGVVLDPFLGSGTTMVAAVEEGFRCIGIEREDEYVPIARARASAAKAPPPPPPLTQQDLERAQVEMMFTPSPFGAGAW